MSNIHNLEPQAYGLITIKTTFGNLDIELFTKQCPKATRNFVQNCLNGRYNNTIFERVEKDFIAIGGALPNSSEKDDDEEYFPDEFHSRLRFSRRGLLATANTKKNENGPKFFFTLGPTPELQGKHTIFGRVKGNSVYNLVELNECHVDEDCCPFSEQRITEVIVTENPYLDLTPEEYKLLLNKKRAANSSSSDSDSDDPLSRPRPKHNKKLSFYPESDESSAEEEEDKHTFDIKPKLEATSVKQEPGSEQTGDSKLYQSKKVDEEVFKTPKGKMKLDSSDYNEDSDLHSDIGNEDIDAKEKRLREIRAQILKIKEQIERGSETKTRAERRQQRLDNSTSDTASQNDSVAKESDSSTLSSATKKSKERERETLELVGNFKKKLKEASKVSSEEEDRVKRRKYDDDLYQDEMAALDCLDDDTWLKHKFVADND